MKVKRPLKRPKSDAGLEAAIRSVGGLTRLANLLNVKHPAISGWKRCPAERVPEVSRLSGIPRHVLRPDLYEAPTPPAPAGRKQREAA
jgi:DNA-binding transcriptional regulator YdaS (Cro superfamily)